MRFPKSLTVGLVLAVSAAVALTGCSKKTESGPSGGGDQIKIAFVPKIQGIPYFEAMNTGGKKAAQDLGVQWIFNGPTTADPAAQTSIVRSLIQQRVNAIVVAPNDPDSIAPVLAEAKSKGITVMTSDTDAPNSERQLFVNQATAQGVGQAVTDALLQKMGGAGKYAIVSCGQTAANLNSWIDVQKAYTAQKYPNAQIVDVVYAGEDQSAAVSMAKDLMNAHPDLTGLVGECTTSAPGVAQAVQEAGKVGTVHTVGVGTPQSMKQYLTSGASDASVLWNVENLGYLTAWAATQLVNNKPLAETNHVSDALPAVKYSADQEMLLLGDPLVLTPANVDQFNY
jgi:rhamnose transport system substrate-binding protein